MGEVGAAGGSMGRQGEAGGAIPTASSLQTRRQCSQTPAVFTNARVFANAFANALVCKRGVCERCKRSVSRQRTPMGERGVLYLLRTPTLRRQLTVKMS